MARSEAAAKSVAKLFAPADVKKVPRTIAPLQNGAMLTVVVGRRSRGRSRPRRRSAHP